jgi:hypothetical protein
MGVPVGRNFTAGTMIHFILALVAFCLPGFMAFGFIHIQQFLLHR